jgi:hemerythrin-like domain-containing protein
MVLEVLMARNYLTLVENCSKQCSEDCNCSIMPDCVGPIETEMQQHFSKQLDLCRQLEEIADELPQKNDRQRILVVARSIFPTVKKAHRFEENRIFPHIEIKAEKQDSLKFSLERLQYEHWEDESFAEELSDGLIRFVADCEEPSTNTLAYMLRGFFEGLRRHIAFEAEHIMPLLRRKETAQQSPLL